MTSSVPDSNPVAFSHEWYRTNNIFFSPFTQRTSNKSKMMTGQETKLIHHRRILCSSCNSPPTIETPLVYRSTKLELHNIHKQWFYFSLFCFSFLPRTKPKSIYIKTICKLRIVDPSFLPRLRIVCMKMEPMFCYPRIFLLNVWQIGSTNSSKLALTTQINLSPKKLNLVSITATGYDEMNES